MAHNLFQFENYMPALTNTTHNNTFTSTAHTNTTQHTYSTSALPPLHHTHTALYLLHTAHTHCAHTPPPHFRGHHISTTGLHTAHMELALSCSQQPSTSLSLSLSLPSSICQAHLSHHTHSLLHQSSPSLSSISLSLLSPNSLSISISLQQGISFL